MGAVREGSDSQQKCSLLPCSDPESAGAPLRDWGLLPGPYPQPTPGMSVQERAALIPATSLSQSYHLLTQILLASH